MRIAKAYLGTTISFLLIDAVWISLFVSNYYRETVDHLLNESPNFLAAGLFYLAYTAGIVALAVKPAIASGRLKTALVNGGVLGAVAYGTYTLTNFAVMRGWTAGLMVSDILWGTFLTAVAAGCGYLVARETA